MIVLKNCKDLPQKLTQNEYFYIQNSGEQQNWFQDKITGTQCTQQKLKLDFRFVTLKIRKCNATKNSQVVIKVSTQNTMKENNPIDLLLIFNDNKFTV